MLPKELYSKIKIGNERALAKACSLIEDRSEGYLELLKYIYPHSGFARIVGLTGAPGSGKSSLLNTLAIELVSRKQKVAIIAVDPSSQVTSGAVLGDRIRMKTAAESKDIFVRSVSSRGQRGGVALAISDLINLFDAADFNYILLETVGVGQVETDVVDLVDLTGLVLTPGMGDEVQAMKAGILELVNFICLNKSDYAGIDLLEAIIKSSLTGQVAAKEIFLTRTNALTASGVLELANYLESYFDSDKHITARVNKHRCLLLSRITREIELLVRKNLDAWLKFASSNLREDCLSKKIHPAQAAQIILSSLVKK